MTLSRRDFTLVHGVLTSTSLCVRRFRSHWRHAKDVAGAVAKGDRVATCDVGWLRCCSEGLGGCADINGEGY